MQQPPCWSGAEVAAAVPFAAARQVVSESVVAVWYTGGPALLVLPCDPVAHAKPATLGGDGLW